MALIIILVFAGTKFYKYIKKHKEEWDESQYKQKVALCSVAMVLIAILSVVALSIHETLPDTIEYDKEYLLAVSTKGKYTTTIFHMDNNDNPTVSEIINEYIRYEKHDDIPYPTITFEKHLTFNLVATPIPYNGYRVLIKYTDDNEPTPELMEVLDKFIDYMTEKGYLIPNEMN